MTGLRFEWDQAKDISNRRKHGLSFEEASRAFLDPMLLTVRDRVQDGEERWLAIGVVTGLILIVVAHTVRDEAGGETIRMISARRADSRERRNYENETGNLRQ